MQALRNENIKVVCINPAAVETEVRTALTGPGQKVPGSSTWQWSEIMVPPPQMTQNRGMVNERMLRPEDIAEAILYALKSSSQCVPQDMTIRLALSAMA